MPITFTKTNESGLIQLINNPNSFIQAVPSATVTRSLWTVGAGTTNAGTFGGSIDGSQSTSWSTGAYQSIGQVYAVNFNQRLRLNSFTMDTNNATNDYPGQIAVSASQDGINWTGIGTVNGSVNFTYTFPSPTLARQLRFTLTSTRPWYWNISEFNVNASVAADEGIRFLKTGMITDNLVMHLQSGNPRSYIGSGSTWNDIVGGDNNVSLINAPTYNATDSNGSLEFNGVDEYGTFSLTGIPSGTSPRTVSLWVKTLTTSGLTLAFSYGTSLTGQGFSLGINNGAYILGGYASDVSGGTATANTWVNLVGIYDGVTAAIYVNGSLITSTGVSWSTGTTTGNIGRFFGDGYYWKGSIASVTVYNIALTATQVLQNFNATRRRFGV